jgi:hypothetical protein
VPILFGEYMKFRKKPVVIEAYPIWNIVDTSVKFDLLPEWVRKGLEDDTIAIGRYAEGEPFLSIRTLEGTMVGRKPDWLIQGVNGELYPCNNDIFEKTYDAVEASKS